MELEKKNIAKNFDDDFFKKIFFDSPVMMLIVDVNKNVLAANNIFLEISGYKNEYILNKNINLFLIEKSCTTLFCELNISETSKYGHLTTINNNLLDVFVDTKTLINKGIKQLLLSIKDITLQIKTEEEILRQKQYFKALTENSPNIIARFNKNLECIYINPTVRKEFNKEPSKFIEKKPIDFGIDIQVGQLLQDLCIEVLEDGKEKNVEYCLKINEKIKHYQSRIIPEFSTDGIIESFLIVTRNSTKYVNAITMLESNIKQISFINKIIIQCNQATSLKELLSNILSSVITHFNFDSGAFYLYDDLQKKAVLSHSIGLNNIFEKTIRVQDETNLFFKKVYEKKEIFFIQNEDDLKEITNNKISIKSILITPIVSRNKVIGALYLINNKNTESIDIIKNNIFSITSEIGSAIERIQSETLHRKSEDSYRNLVESINDLVWKINEFMVYDFVSSKSYDLLGYLQDEMNGNSFYKFIPLNEHLFIKNLFKENQNHQQKFSFETPLIHKNGSIIYVEVNGYPILDENRKLLGYSGTNRDISLRKKNEELRNSKEVSERMNRVKQQFFSNISHEIRTPLNSIIGLSEIISNKIQNDETQTYINGIQANSKSLLRIINDVLDLSKIDAGKLTLEPEPTNIFRFFEEIKNIFEISAKNKNIDFIIEISKTKHPTLIIDEIRLRQILSNLISNAIKFTDKGFVKIEVLIIESKENNNLVDLIILVKDTGIGIPDEQKLNIWDSFIQTEGQSNKKYGGTGLGLSICKNLVEIMDGTISINNNSNISGTTFKIILPSIVVINTPNIKNYYNPLLVGKNIIVIDNEKNSYNIITQYLSNNKCNINYLNPKSVDTTTLYSLNPDIIIVNYDIYNYYESNNIFNIERILTFNNSSKILLSNNNEDISEIPFCDILKQPFNQKTLYDSLLIAINKTFTIKKDLEIIPISNEIEKMNIENINTLIEEIEIHCFADWEIAKYSNSINDIIIFANKINEVAKKQKINFLKFYAKEIIFGAKTFDINKLSILINYYPELINYLKNQISTNK